MVGINIPYGHLQSPPFINARQSAAALHRLTGIFQLITGSPENAPKKQADITGADASFFMPLYLLLSSPLTQRLSALSTLSLAAYLVRIFS